MPPASAVAGISGAARTSTRSCRRHVRGNSKSGAHGGADIVDGNGFHITIQLAVHDESETIFVERLVIFFRPVQGHSQRGAASSTGI
jgi:hypothetical protein